jgi:superfamily I DNA and/or RNA helicase
MDVRGKQARSSTGSLTNRAEAAAIATKLTEWMTSEDGKHLKFGVISFYRAQADLIQRNLSGTVDPDRLLVGTVDSFQGREFDVVFLSVVKTAGGFGFLELYNRLNVAMSRQEKLLVAVGDSRFFDTPDARKKVPGLYHFLRLCRHKGAML